MATSNVLVTRTGTNWTVDVTACDLDPDTNLKDFITFVGGSVVSNASFNKTTQTTLTYVGTALPSNTQIEIRRKSPNVVKSAALLGSRVRSSDWNAEFDRVHRHFEEYDLNGAGSPVQAPIPKDEPFGSGWDGDTVYPPSRNAVYDYVNTLAPLSSPAFTGNPTVPTQNGADNSTRIANTAWVRNILTLYATLASPSFTGSPTVPTAGAADNSTIIANTSWVRTFVNTSLTSYVSTGSLTSTLAAYVTTTNLTSTLSSYASLASPTFTGTPTAPTATLSLAGTQVANQTYVHTAQRPFLDTTRITSSQSFPHNTFTQIIFNNEVTDTANMHDTTTGNIVIPTGFGGTYEVSGFIAFDAPAIIALVEVWVNGSTVKRIGQAEGAPSGISFNGVFNASAGQTVTLRLYQISTASATRTHILGTALNWMTMKRVNV